VSRGPGRGVRWPRSPRGAGSSAARARPRAASRRSGREPLAPLGSTTSEHAPTALRSHAGHEAVLALARALLGLIRPLHRCVPVPRSAQRSWPFTHERLAFRQPLRTVLRGPSRLPGILAVGHLAGQTAEALGPAASAVAAGRQPTVRTWVGTPAQRFMDSGRPPMRAAGEGPHLRPTLPGRNGRCYSGRTPGSDAPKRLRSGPVGGLIVVVAAPVSARRSID
jgi:hypothetical protein